VGIFLGMINMGAVLCLNLLSGHLIDDLMNLMIRLAMGFFGGIFTGILVAGYHAHFEVSLAYHLY